jgi:membrane protein
MPAIVKLHSISWTEVFKRTWKEANEDDVLGRSAQLAYYFFLALFPLLICVITVLGVLDWKGANGRTQCSTFWLAYFLARLPRWYKRLSPKLTRRMPLQNCQ